MSKTLLINVGALAAIGLAVGGLAPAKPAFASDQLTVTSFGGPAQDADRKAFFEPFSKETGIKVNEDVFNGEISKIRAMVESKSVSWDVVDLDPGLAAQLCAEGTVEPIDWKKLGVDRATFIESGTSDCGVPEVVTGKIVAYDKDKFTNGPKTIADVFDTQKFPGKRGLQRRPLENLEWAVIADGVPLNDVYKVLSTPEGVDRAFKKLDTIKKDIIWYQTSSQAPQLLADGQVVMASALSSRIVDAVKKSGKHFEIMWDTLQWNVGVWVIPTGTPHRDAAYKLLAYMSLPKPQADFSNLMPYGPSNKAALALVDPAVLPNLPNAPDHMTNALRDDAAFWAEKGDELTQRFTAWLAK
ncbi:spermidine/putrescine ABC transporter substrate-binding protein [Bradyrhizobium sacchari]|uniref:Putative spermidine/putrescine transport system substrate-binding protein n=1 Tax=Bradyrhizobium sacchari TaxID=1399419 RepID=A0A560J9B0_9BRAD|nr:ABC transporter substrate-binding protein [Bradyrhizobium sacchari]OPY95436.1 spermidine/putrescine ABC transporter substrate-binding protein [Bradyrhizobium sacchari]TWB46994.1 putative spermidine/putrescine transport system substrate-binding protein [Bradyrhizobium sacchari]TWB65894.1 putative spermidine/putrescine transport system substrate-binding protein [Bradyrhizobium sacchari]